MAITSGFYNSLNHDRKYSAEEMSSIFDGLINDGVFESVGDKFKVSPGPGLQVMVGSGRAWFVHTWVYNDANEYLTLGAADPLRGRKDAIVLTIDHSTAVRAAKLEVIAGTVSDNPAKPTITSTNLIKRVPLAYVTVGAGATSISVGNIEINVGKNDCPYVTGIIQVTSVESLWQQWGAEFAEDLQGWTNSFNSWFQSAKALINEQTVTQLQQNLSALQTDYSTFKGTTVPNTYITKTVYNEYTGTTAPNTFLNKTTEKATAEEVTAGTDNNKFVTPSTLSSAMADAINKVAQTNGYSKMVVLSYTGNNQNTKVLTCGFRPILMFITVNPIANPGRPQDPLSLNPYGMVITSTFGGDGDIVYPLQWQTLVFPENLVLSREYYLVQTGFGNYDTPNLDNRGYIYGDDDDSIINMGDGTLFCTISASGLTLRSSYSYNDSEHIYNSGSRSYTAVFLGK